MAQPGELERRLGADDEAAIFAADREVGRDLASVDWAATPIGPPAGWPQSLRTAVGILLSSRFPMWMGWGPQLTFFCNAAYRRDTLGRKYPWALGRPAREVWAEIWDDIEPRVHTVLEGGKATWDEALLLFPERSGYSEETYHTFSYSPLRDDAGAVAGLLCVVSEETERVIGARRMATLRDLGSDPSVVRTEQEVLTFAARQLERNPHDLPFTLTYLFDENGTAHLAAMTGIHGGHPAAPATLSAADGDAIWPLASVARAQTTLVELNGGPFARMPAGAWPEPPVRALVVPLLQQGGASYGFLVAGVNRYRALDEGYRGFVELAAGHLAAGIGSARTYQAQQRRAEELAELDRAKTTFFSNISHEFRTPLTLIMGPVEEMRARLAGQDRRSEEELEIVRRNAMRLGRLVNTLLDFSRIEAGRMQARYEPADLAAVTAELASVFRSAIERAGLEFVVDCPPLPEPVYIDRGMWEKVVLNLLSNALKFTFDGSVRVSVRGEAGHAVVVIADTGVGVPEPEISRLFERFHRVEATRARSNEGSGIGLALVKELVGLHGGTIAARSAAAEGTTFTVRLPFGQAHLPADALVPAEAAQATESVTTMADPFIQEALRWLPSDDDAAGDADVTEQMPVVPVGEDETRVATTPARVLVADDNADMRDYLARLLQRAGYHVEAVRDGRVALTRAQAQPPDLIISDVMMPGLDGLQLVAALRGEERTAGVSVLLLSARAGQESSVEGLEAGADDYLVKPFSAVELLARVRANLDMARLRSHQARWRTALVNSLQEAFFVADEQGAVIETNSAFERMLGYGPQGLPYQPEHPWWPDPQRDPQGYRLVADNFARVFESEQGVHRAPVVHRDGHRLWVETAFSWVQDPDTGRKVIVGTLRDVTTEFYGIQRESAVAALSVSLSQATSLPQALAAALRELRSLWKASSAVAVVFGDSQSPAVTSVDAEGSVDAETSWQALSDEQRAVLSGLHRKPTLQPFVADGGAGIGLEHPHGPMLLWLDLGLRPFTDADETLLTVLAGHLTHGLTRAHQIDQQRETALALQRAMLGPADLPVGFAVRYEPAARPLEVGGDWYDVVPLAAGRIGIVVGDCVGRGLQAATVMGQLRSACRALLLRDECPERVLADLDVFARRIPAAVCTTVFCAVIDPQASSLTYSSAGHPPPILCNADGKRTLLTDAQSVPLAINRKDGQRPQTSVTLEPGATLVLYTDGLIERRHQAIDDGIDAAGGVLVRFRDLHPDELADKVMGDLTPGKGFDDDVAMLIYRHPPAPLDITLPAEPASLATIRATLRAWLPTAAIPAALHPDILIAVGEATSNAVEHATGQSHSAEIGEQAWAGTPATQIQVRVAARVTDTRLTLTVSDTGVWRQPPEDAAGRGRGIPFMRALMDHVEIVPQECGTTVTMTKGLNP